MHDIEGLSIEALAELRDAASVRLADRVAARHRELQAEADRIRRTDRRSAGEGAIHQTEVPRA